MAEFFDDIGAHYFKVLVILLMQTIELKLFMLMPRLHLFETLLELAEVVNE